VAALRSGPTCRKITIYGGSINSNYSQGLWVYEQVTPSPKASTGGRCKAHSHRTRPTPGDYTVGFIVPAIRAISWVECHSARHNTICARAELVSARARLRSEPAP
jgi:hypothetical protein